MSEKCNCGDPDCGKNDELREKVRYLTDKIKAKLLELDTEVAVATGHGKEKVFPDLSAREEALQKMQDEQDDMIVKIMSGEQSNQEDKELKEIAVTQRQISKCLEIQADLNMGDPDPQVFSVQMFRGGWRISMDQIEKAGLDPALIYDFIYSMAEQQKEDLEKQILS